MVDICASVTAGVSVTVDTVESKHSIVEQIIAYVRTNLTSYGIDPMTRLGWIVFDIRKRLVQPLQETEDPLTFVIVKHMQK